MIGPRFGSAVALAGFAAWGLLVACATPDSAGEQSAARSGRAMVSGGTSANTPRSGEAGRRRIAPEIESRFAVVGLPCGSAGATLESWVRSNPAVSRCRFDPRTVTLSVMHDPKALPPAELARLIESRGLQVIRGGQRGLIRPPVVFPQDLDVLSLPYAVEDEIEDHLVRGKVTVFHLRAPSGECCSDLDLNLAVLMQSRDDIALRRIVAVGVPSVVVYAATAHRFGPFPEDAVEAIEAAILEAGGGDRVRLAR